MEQLLSARIFGSITASSARPPADLTAIDRSSYSLIEFDGGFVAHDSHVSAHQAGPIICLVAGLPRFDSDELDTLARREGAASAWLDALERWGEATPTHAKGRFSVVLLDTARKHATLVTDRFATRPLCYSSENGTLAFSDRADSVPGGSREISPQAIYDYLYFHVIPAPETVFRGVLRLDAAHRLDWSPDACEPTRWWQPRFYEHEFGDLEERKQRFLDIVQASVANEAGGGEVGCFLSGGTDSSTVAGMLTRVLGQPAKSYSIGFDASGYDEMEYARIAAKRFGVDHREYYVTPDDLLEGIPKVATHYDQPFGNSSAVPAWICASRARSDGITKLLAGDGGDELFGGNTRYAKQRIFGWYEHIPGLMRKVALEPALRLPGMGRVPLIKKGVSYVEQARVPMPDRFQMHNLLERLGPANLFEPDFLSRIDRQAPHTLQRATWAASGTDNLINRMLEWDWKYTLADNDLPKVVGSTALAGVDVGFPLLSDELVDFSLHIPPDWKLKGLTLRWFFKEALRGFLPDEIITKKKHGFGLPFGVWACQHPGLKAFVHATLSSLKAREIVRADFIDELLDTHLHAHPGYYGDMVWNLMMLELWLGSHESVAKPI